MTFAGAPSSAAGIVNAFAGVITACSLVITALALLLPILKRTRAVEHKVDDVHQMVNQQRTDAMAFQAKLVAALNAAGVPVPVDESLQPGPGPPTTPT